MKIIINYNEYDNIVKDILNNKEFKKIEYCPHHKTNRLEHSKRVSLYAYKVCKILNLDYVSAARGGLLHDFFLNSYTSSNGYKLMRNHPLIALNKAKKYFKLNQKEKNIISSHMFPLNIKNRPKYRESFIVSMIDKIICVYEKTLGYVNDFNFKMGKFAIYIFLFMFT